jgi:hypothetical protein
MFLYWWRGLARTADPKNATSQGSRRWRFPRKLRYAARVEQLEDRVVPAGSTKVFLNVGANVTNIVAARSTTVPVFIDVDALNGGAGGIQSGTFYVQYDPNVLAINEATVAPGTTGSDIKLGNLLTASVPAGTYQLITAAGFSSGIVGIGITNNGQAFYTGTAAGHLVELDFHVLQTINVDQTTVLDLVARIPGKQTVVADMAGGKYTLTPAPTTYAGSLTQTGALTLATLNPANADATDATIQVVAKTPAVKPTAADDTFSMAPSNGSFPNSLTVTGANGVLANDTDTNGPMNAVLVLGSTASTAALATPREFATATTLASGKVLVVGGLNGTTPLASAELYDPAAGTWSAAASLATARSGQTATLLGNGKVLVVGGLGASGPLASAELYDPQANTWSPAGTLATARSGQTATLLATGKVLVVGGTGASGALASAELYDPAANTWSAAASLAAARASHTATLLKNGQVLVTGGQAGATYLSSAELYDPAANSWSAAASLSVPRAQQTATLLASGKVLVAGGTSDGTTSLASAELYDPQPNKWVAAASLATPRMGQQAVALANGQVLVSGGLKGTAALASMEVYDPASDTWSAAGSMATARAGAAVSPLGNGKVLVAGGNNGSGFLASAEVYAPTAAAATITTGSATVGNTYTVTYTMKTAHGSVTLNAQDGSFTYTPDSNFVGVDSFSYQAVDALTNAASVNAAPATNPGATTTVNLVVGGLVSVPQNLTVDGTVANSTVVVPVNIASANPGNSGGLSAVQLGINYDKTKFTVTKVDPGKVLKDAGWSTFVANTATAGRVDITAGGSPIASLKGGDLVDITFQIIGTPAGGPSVVNVADSTGLFVAGTGTPLVLPLASPAVNNTTNVPGVIDGVILIRGLVQPALNVTPTTLDLGSTPAGTAGAAKTYTVGGTNLTGDITITVPTGAEISQDGTTYQASLKLSPDANGTVATKTISVRISASAQGNVSGAINNSTPGTTPQNVTVSGTVTTAGPTITISATSLDLGTTTQGTAGAGKTFTVSGANLTAPIAITAPAGVELSSDNGATYKTTVTLTPASGIVANTTVTARIASGASAGAVTGKVTNTSTGATEQDITLTGTVSPVGGGTRGPTGTLFLEVGGDATKASVTGTRSSVVKVYIDAGSLSAGANGVQSGTFYVKYDPTVLAINESSVKPGSTGSDIKLGDLLTASVPAGTYDLITASGFASGIVGVGLTNNGQAFYTGTAGGHLVELDFHVLQTIPVGSTTLVDLVDRIPGKQTVLADKSGQKYTLTPGPTSYSGTLTQSGALTPGTLSPADADGNDVALQVLAGTPAVTPKAVDDVISVTPNNGAFPNAATVSGSAGVLANDATTGGPLNAVLVGGSAITTGSGTVNGTYTVTYTQKTAHGSVTLNALDGSFTYTPDAGYTGQDSFTYQAVDAVSNTSSNTATVTLNVGALVNIPQNLTVDTAAGATVKVPVNIASANPVGSGGVVAVTIELNYDKTKFSVKSVDIGSVLKAAGWTTFVANTTVSGKVDITAAGPALTAVTGGDLAMITLQTAGALTASKSVVNLAASTSVVVAGAGTGAVLPFAVPPADNTGNTPNAADGLITIGQPTSNPAITVSATSLDLGTTPQGTAGAGKTYTVSGSSLTAPITITAPTGVELSSDNGASYKTSVSLTPDATGAVATTTITARIAAGAPAGPVTGKVTNTSTGTTEQDVTVTGTVTAAVSPTITVSATALDLGTTTQGTAGAGKTYTVGGTNLTTPITITAPTGVELSSDSGASYKTTVTLTPSSGTVANTTITVRITASATTGSIAGKVTNTSTGATEQDVSLTGTVSPSTGGARGPTGTLFLEVGGDATKANVAGARSSVVKVYIDAGSLSAGANGVQSGTFYVKYDPTVLAINESSVKPGSAGSDIKLGDLLTASVPSGTYDLITASGFGSGIVGVGLTNNGQAFYTGTAGGHLVELDFLSCRRSRSAARPWWTWWTASRAIRRCWPTRAVRSIR